MTKLFYTQVLDDENELLINQIYYNARKLTNELERNDKNKRRISERCEFIINAAELIKEYEGE